MLQALAVLMGQQEAARTKCMDADMLPAITAALGGPPINTLRLVSVDHLDCELEACSMMHAACSTTC